MGGVLPRGEEGGLIGKFGTTFKYFNEKVFLVLYTIDSTFSLFELEYVSFSTNFLETMPVQRNTLQKRRPDWT